MGFQLRILGNFPHPTHLHSDHPNLLRFVALSSRDNTTLGVICRVKPCPLVGSLFQILIPSGRGTREVWITPAPESTLTYHFPSRPEALRRKLPLRMVRGGAGIGIQEGGALGGAQEGERGWKNSEVKGTLSLFGHSWPYDGSTGVWFWKHLAPRVGWNLACWVGGGNVLDSKGIVIQARGSSAEPRLLHLKWHLCLNLRKSFLRRDGLFSAIRKLLLYKYFY